MATIRKVKLKDALVEIHLTESTGKEERESILKSYEAPHPDLVNAFADLVKSVYEILSLPREWATGQMKVTGVSFSDSLTTGVKGAVITFQVALETSDSPFCGNTPHLPFEPYAPGGGGNTMPDSAVERLTRLAEEAASFIGGKRAQRDWVKEQETAKV